MKHVITFLASAIFALSTFTFFSCNSNKPIPDDLTAKELIQRGQESFEKGWYKQSLNYFNAVVDRYGTDPALYAEARYEIGHLYMRKKDYENAVEVLEELTTLYASNPVGTFPPAYDKLAKLELAKIPEDKLEAAHKSLKEKAEKRQKEIEAEIQHEQLQQNLQQANEQASAQNTQAEQKQEEPAQENSEANTDAEQPEQNTQQ
ncbi:MAG: hypothetical protein IJS09_10075 [Treponema sp.]|nr:hypothetical protein [Treponema sp.]